MERKGGPANLRGRVKHPQERGWNSQEHCHAHGGWRCQVSCPFARQEACVCGLRELKAAQMVCRPNHRLPPCHNPAHPTGQHCPKRYYLNDRLFGSRLPGMH